MFHNNGSHSSLSSREKELPPIPGEPLLAPKSLHRKNVKQLSFTPPEQADYSGELSRFERLGARKARTRPAPLLHLDLPHEPIIASLEGLELAEPALGAASTQRKRQTVILSISPTKSDALPGPLSLHPSPLPTTPLLTMASGLAFRSLDLVHLKDLGAGNFGAVLKVFHVPLLTTMAMKVVHVDLKQEVQTQIIRELRIMHECRSPYIIEFYGAFVRLSNSIVICMEYCNCGSLDKIVPLCRPLLFPLHVVRKLLFAMLSGLVYLYDTHKIIHRDIKPSNVLMTHRGDFKLCDFGVSRELTNSLAMADTFVGTSTYMSPERIQGLAYGIKSDVWSMGIMLYELVSGRSVWSDDADDGVLRPSEPEGILDLLQRIVNERSPTLAAKLDRHSLQPFDPHLCLFIDFCLIKDDQQRKSPWELLDHPFLDRVALGTFDKDVRAWAKKIRKSHKETHDQPEPI